MTNWLWGTVVGPLFYITISFLLIGLTTVVTTLLVEIIAACVANKRIRNPPTCEPSCPRISVLIPAHNETVGIISTIVDAKSQLRDADQVLVVADNCSDDTAAVARAQGASVVERNDSEHRGKGYALSVGIACLSRDPPDIVIIVDADCQLSPGAIKYLTATCMRLGRPAQANYIMKAPAGTPFNYNVAEFAWKIKNYARPLGLLSLGGPCQLTGSGMAFPWSAISTARLATGNIVEDMALGIELTLLGKEPIFCPSAEVISKFPVSKKGIETQRRRWKHGHFKTITSSIGPLIVSGAAKRNFAQIILALDLAIPPLSALVFLTFLILVLSFSLQLFGLSATPFYVAVTDAFVLLLTVVLAWIGYGRDILPITAIPQIAPYLLNQMQIYQRILRAKGPAQWTRTDRK